MNFSNGIDVESSAPLERATSDARTTAAIQELLDSNVEPLGDEFLRVHVSAGEDDGQHRRDEGVHLEENDDMELHGRGAGEEADSQASRRRPAGFRRTRAHVTHVLSDASEEPRRRTRAYRQGAHQATSNADALSRESEESPARASGVVDTSETNPATSAEMLASPTPLPIGKNYEAPAATWTLDDDFDDEAANPMPQPGLSRDENIEDSLGLHSLPPLQDAEEQADYDYPEEEQGYVVDEDGQEEAAEEQYEDEQDLRTHEVARSVHFMETVEELSARASGLSSVDVEQAAEAGDSPFDGLGQSDLEAEEEPLSDSARLSPENKKKKLRSLRRLTMARPSCRPKVSCTHFPFCSAECPCLFACLFLLLCSVVLVFLWPGFQVNNDMSAFLEADSPANAIRAAFSGALPFRDPETDSGAQRRLFTGDPPSYDGNTMYKTSILTLFYEGEDLMTSGSLSAIKSLETKLKGGERWQKICALAPGWSVLCDPGFSVANAAFPEASTEDAVPPQVADVQLKLTGRGRAIPIETVWRILASHQTFHDAMLPKSYTMGDKMTTARSVFYFNMECCDIADSRAVRSKMLKVLGDGWKEFVAEELHPALLEFNKRGGPVTVYFDGDWLTTFQLWKTLSSDSLMAAGSIAFIISYLTFHAGSPLVSCGSIFLTVLAIPTAFVCSAVISGSNEVTGAAFLSLFLISGLGADVVLVFVAFWESSKSDCGVEDTAARIRYLYHNAGLACLATTLTTAASFFANLASVLRALREFGFFMGLCICWAYIYLLVGLPALLTFNEKAKRCCCHMCPKMKCESSVDLSASQNLWAKVCKSCSLESILVRNRFCWFLLFPATVIGFAVWTASAFKVDSGVPKMFPKDHNLNKMQIVSAKFQAPQEYWVKDRVTLCNFERHQNKYKFDQCIMNQCQISLATDNLTILGQPGFFDNGSVRSHAECVCMPTGDKPRCRTRGNNQRDQAKLTIRVVGNLPEGALRAWRGSEAFKRMAVNATRRSNYFDDYVLNFLVPESIEMVGPGGGDDDVGLLVQQYWETGSIQKMPYQVIPDYAFPIEGPNRSWMACDAEEVCYCGAGMCTYVGDQLVSPGSDFHHVVQIPSPPTESTPARKTTATMALTSTMATTATATTMANTATAATTATIATAATATTDQTTAATVTTPHAHSSPSNLNDSLAPTTTATATVTATIATTTYAPSNHSDNVMATPTATAAATATVVALGDTTNKAEKGGSTASGIRRLEHGMITSDERYSGAAMSRRLFSTSAVSLVWGLKIKPGSPLLGKREKSWEYNRIFRADSPNTQRMLLQACRKAREMEDLLIVDDECWIENFRDWLASRGQPFPVPGRRFLPAFKNWRATPGQETFPHTGVVVKDFMWLDQDGSLKATYARFTVQVNSRSSAASTLIKYMSRWNELVEAINSEAPLEAGDTWHTSGLWIRAEAETAIISSTVNTMLVSAGCGFLGALFFTHLDVLLSTMVVITVAGVTISLAWFMIVFMSWPVGAMEVLGLIVFVGYSITYSLHIAHKYQEHVIKLAADVTMNARERRKEAVLHSMRCMSGAVIGSAVTTLGSSFFLFFCQLVIFVKLASVLFAVTFFAMIFATVALPAALLCVGPTSSGWAVTLWTLVMRFKAGDIRLSEIGNEPPQDRNSVRTMSSKKSLAMVAQQPTPTAPARKLPGDEDSVTHTTSGEALLKSSQPFSRPLGMLTGDSQQESRKTEAFPKASRKTEVFLSTPQLSSASPALSGRALPSPSLGSVAPAPLGRRCTSVAAVAPGSPSRSASSMRQTTAATFWGEHTGNTPAERRNTLAASAPMQTPSSPGFRSLQEWSSKPSLPSPAPAHGVPSPSKKLATLSRPAVPSYVGGGGTGQLPSWSSAAIASRMSTTRPVTLPSAPRREANNRQ